MPRPYKTDSQDQAQDQNQGQDLSAETTSANETTENASAAESTGHDSGDAEFEAVIQSQITDTQESETAASETKGSGVVVEIGNEPMAGAAPMDTTPADETDQATAPKKAIEPEAESELPNPVLEGETAEDLIQNCSKILGAKAEPMMVLVREFCASQGIPVSDDPEVLKPALQVYIDKELGF